MREIKFKLIDNNEFMGMVELKSGGIIDVGYCWDTAYQYTGLKDKNGKDIYEGDIVRYDLGDREAKLEGEENRYDYAQIVFDNGQFLTLNHDGATLDEIVAIGQDDPWEVIGNIYENPELLRQS